VDKHLTPGQATSNLRREVDCCRANFLARSRTRADRQKQETKIGPHTRPRQQRILCFAIPFRSNGWRNGGADMLVKAPAQIVADHGGAIHRSFYDAR
jgi:hypothetical protein